MDRGVWFGRSVIALIYEEMFIRQSSVSRKLLFFLYIRRYVIRPRYVCALLTSMRASNHLYGVVQRDRGASIGPCTFLPSRQGSLFDVDISFQVDPRSSWKEFSKQCNQEQVSICSSTVEWLVVICSIHDREYVE